VVRLRWVAQWKCLANAERQSFQLHKSRIIRYRNPLNG
jgi:hypothetical protein